MTTNGVSADGELRHDRRLHAAALVAIDGSIDWLWIPHFDSPSVFARILDEEKGGHFSIRPVDDGFTCKQFYWRDANVLVTRYLAEGGAAELTDFMPIASSGGSGPKRRQVIRRLTAVRGSVGFCMECQPTFDYARARHETNLEANGARFSSNGLRLGLAASTPLVVDGSGVAAEFTLDEGETAVFVLRELGDEITCGTCLSEGGAEAAFRDPVDYWRSWLSECRYTGRRRDMVHRSALALKLLTFEPTGAIYDQLQLDIYGELMDAAYIYNKYGSPIGHVTAQLRRRWLAVRLRGEEGTFNIFTFWLVEALTRAGRFDPARLEEARLMFERMLGFANHVSLYAEETGMRGEALGNFPQAFTHLARISAAFNLDRALDKGH